MKNLSKKKVMVFLFAAVLCFSTLFFAAACGGTQTQEQLYIVSVEKTSTNGTEDIYTITYSDGTITQFTVSDGESEKNLTVSEIWEEYKAQTGEEISFSEFIDQYLDLTTDHSAAVSESLFSCVSVYAEFVETQTIGGGNFFPGGGMGNSVTSSQVVQSGGSGVIYEIDEDSVYIVTNYHVVYDAAADEEKNGGSKIARNIYCYLYGSEITPELSGYDEDNYYVYEYGDYAIECEYIGGSLEADIAVLKADKESVFAVNENVKEASFADGYRVGESVYAIGNAEGEGISVTEGVISVDNEYISLDIDEDGTYESYRSVRFDAAIYHGNSGGGLFNVQGELIGITNAGIESSENLCYAIPASIAEGTVENILYHYRDGNDETNGVYKITLGISVSAQNAKYVLGEDGYGKITEEIYVEGVSAGSIAEEIGLAAGDRVLAIVIGSVEYSLDRTFDIGDLLLTLRPGDALQIVYERGGEQYTTQSYMLGAEMFAKAE